MNVLTVAMTFDWASLLEPQPTPEVDLIAQLQQLVAAMPELLHTGAVFLLYAGVGIVLSWGLMVFILPGIALHEFGHYAAARRAGASVDSYGLLLLGPVLGGAYVEPGDDAEDLPADKKYGIWAAGIGNSMLWGTVLLAGGLALSGDPGAVLFGWLLQDFGVFTSQPVASLLLALGIMEVANSFLNAMPFGPVDGGGFVRTAEEDLWGLDETTPFDRRIRQLLGDEAEPQQ